MEDGAKRGSIIVGALDPTEVEESNAWGKSIDEEDRVKRALHSDVWTILGPSYQEAGK